MQCTFIAHPAGRDVSNVTNSLDEDVCCELKTIRTEPNWLVEFAYVRSVSGLWVYGWRRVGSRFTYIAESRAAGSSRHKEFVSRVDAFSLFANMALVHSCLSLAAVMLGV